MNNFSKGLQPLNYLFFFLMFSACQSSNESGTNDISTDEAVIAKGMTLFENNCSNCHNFEQDGIGPHLGGLTEEESTDWIRSFIQNPTKMIDSKDERSREIFTRFKSYMPSFDHLPEEEINALIAYMHRHPEPEEPADMRMDFIINPVPEPIPLSDLVVALELIHQLPPSSEEPPLTRINKLDYRPDTKDLFILDLRGKLYHLDQGKETTYLDMEIRKADFISVPGLATGFGSFAFHPDFANNGLLYTTHTEPAGTKPADFSYADSIKVTLQWVISEWKTNAKEKIPFVGESRELFRIDMFSGVHGVQEITFNPQAKPGDEDYGLLYIGIGDGGSVLGGFPYIPHGATQAWGSIFRIDPRGKNSKNGKYGIPKTNPFVNRINVLPEIYAHGFRNPHRISWTKSGEILATNIGEGQLESIYMLRPGANYGWPVREGNFVIEPEMKLDQVYPLPQNDHEFRYSYPVAMYDHDEGVAISGGYEYTGSEVPELKGKYVFGDISNGQLFYVETADLEIGSLAPIKEWQVSYKGEIQNLFDLTGSKRVDLRFGIDHEGELYLFTKSDGKVYKIVGAR